MNKTLFPLAPPLLAAQWINTPQDITLDALRGKVVVVNGRVYRLIRAAMKLMPDSMALALTARRARSFRRTK